MAKKKKLLRSKEKLKIWRKVLEIYIIKMLPQIYKNSGWKRPKMT